MQPILGTKKIHTVEEDFSKKIMTKNKMQEDFLGKNKASLVLKNENSNGMELFLETLLNLFGQLRSVNTTGNIRLTQNIVKQEIIKQIKNNISVSANTYNYSNVTQLFQSFSSENSFSNNEAIENVINVIESELKKNYLGSINEDATKNYLIKNEPKNSVSKNLWQNVLKKNLSNFNAFYKGENANFFSHSQQFSQQNIKNFTDQNNEYHQSNWNESTKNFVEYSTNVFAAPRGIQNFTTTESSVETVREKRTVGGNKILQVTTADHEKTVFLKAPGNSVLNNQHIFNTQNSNYLAELNRQINFETTGVEENFYKNYVQKFTRSEIGNSFLNFIFNRNYNSSNYNSSVLLKQKNKTVSEANVLRLYPTEIQQALFYGNEFNNYTTHKNHQEVNNFLENQRVFNNSILNWNLQISSLQENFLKRDTNTFTGTFFGDKNYLFNEISQIQQHSSNRIYHNKKGYNISFEQNQQFIENEIFHNQKQTIFNPKVQNLVSNSFGKVYFNNKNEYGINNYSILNNSNLTNQLTYSYIKNIWKKQGNNAQYLLKKEESRNILTLFNFNNEKHLVKEQSLTYKENGVPEEGKSDYVFKPLLIENAIERNKFFIKNTAIFSGIYNYSEEFHNQNIVKKRTPISIGINGDSQFSFKENFYKEIDPNTTVFENKTFNKANISFVQRFFKLNAREMGNVLHQTTIDAGSETQLITDVSKNRNSFLSNYFRNNFYINKQLDSNLFSTQEKNYIDVYEEYKAETSNIQFTQQETYNSTEYKTNKLSPNNTSNFLTRWIKKYESAVKNKLFLSNSFGFTDVKNQKFNFLLNVSSTVINREEDGEKRNLLFWERLLQPIEFATEGSEISLYYGNKPIGREKLMGFYPLINKKYNYAVYMGKAKFKSVQQLLHNEPNNINKATEVSLYFTSKNSLLVSSEENQRQENVFSSVDIYNSLNRNIEPLKTVKGITKKKYYHTTDYTETATNRFLTQIYQKNRLFSITNKENKILVEGESQKQGIGGRNSFLNGLINTSSVENTAETDISKGTDFNFTSALKPTSYGGIPEFGGYPVEVDYKEQPWEENNKKYIENYEVKNSIIHRTKTEEVKTEQEIEEQIKKSVLLEVEEKITKRLLSFKQQQAKEEEEKRKLDLLQQESIEKNDTNSVLNAVEDIDIIYEKVYEKMERALRSERRRIGR
ncbi:MAG: hypothetical protein PHW92_13850, partial [Lutibacter sp.]|nr:hypothetical protein [Lutibacter sp.]